MRQIRDYDEEHVTSWIGRQTPLGIFVKVILVPLVVLSICLTGGHFVFGWFNTAVEVVSPTNVKAQWQFAYDYHENLKAIANNWCTMKKAEDAEANPDYKTQRVSQRLAVETQYRTVQAQYDGRLDDAFRARIVAPPDVPRRAPTLEQTVAETGCMTG
jgi:hypothetical protein